MSAREGLDGQMNPLMPLQIMIPVETLRALITLERSIRGRGSKAMRWWMATIEMLCVGNMATIKARQKPWRHAPHNGHRAVRAMNICHHGAVHRRQRI